MKGLASLFYLQFCLLALGGIAPGAADNTPVEINPHDKRAEIRTELLKYTPLGSSSKDVMAFLTKRLLKKGDPEPAIENHGATGPSADPSKNKGVKSIKLDLADTIANPLLLTLSPPLPYHEALTAQWAFDGDDKLIGLFLDRKLEP